MGITFEGYDGIWVQKDFRWKCGGYEILFTSETETYNLIGFADIETPKPTIIIDTTKCNDLKSYQKEYNEKLNRKIQEKMKRLFDE